jgi:FMN-dependent oxidoreductase (nitrilotriacetate monooxygenase family)
MFHLAWFGGTGPNHWDGPSQSLYDWRQPDIYQDVARLCERAKFDLVIFADGLAVPKVMGSRDLYIRNGQSIQFDPVPIMAMMAAATSRIGFASTLSSTFYPPFMMARMLATMDHMTRGRIAWNLVTTASADAAQNFGYDELLEHDERYDRADEYVALCRALWDSWEPDAVIEDRSAGIFADPAKVHEIDFRGRHYRSMGPLTVTSSPQRHPVICVAGTSPRGMRFSGMHGDMAIAQKVSVAEMKKTVDTLRTEASNAGRDPMSIKISFSIKPVMAQTDAMARELQQWRHEHARIEQGLATLSYYMGINLLDFDLDRPLPDDLKVNGMQSTLSRYRSMPRGTTLRDFAREEALHETFRICGSYEHVADVLEDAAEKSGCDMFHFRAGTLDYDYLADAAMKLVPVLQRRGLVRRDYAGTTLRDHLAEF